MGSGAGKHKYEEKTESKTVIVEPKPVQEEAAPPKFMRSLSPMPAEPMLLCADVGGTNTRLHLFRVPETYTALVPPECMVYQAKYSNVQYDSFTEVAQDFLKKAAHSISVGLGMPPPYLGCFAVAGVVVDNKCNLVNLGWKLDGNQIAEDLGMREVYLMNDFEAQGYGILTLDHKTECDVLQEAPVVPGAPIALLGAGTGLGEAFMTTGENGDYEVWPSEGGHKEFAPRQEGSTNLQTEMMQYLQIRFSAKSRISVERIVSGRGIANIYQFMAWKFPDKLKKEVHSRFVKNGQDPAVIVEAARSGESELSLKTMDLFVGAYGSEAGVMALKLMPFGGLYVTGGVSAKTRDFILGEKGTPHTFMDAFLDKGRVSTMLTRVPVFLCRGEDMGERGVKLKAMRMFAEALQRRQQSKGRQQYIG